MRTLPIIATSNGGTASSKWEATCPVRMQFWAMRTITLLFTFAAVLLSRAQNTGTLRLLVDPGHNFEFIVDKKFRMQQREIKLTEGLHDMSLWAPERMVVDTMVFVVADRTSDLVVRLPFSPEYVTYRKEMAQYQQKKRWTRAAPLLVLAGGLTWTAISAMQYGKAKDVLDADRENYTINADPRAIEALKAETIPAANKELKNARTQVYLASGFSVVSAAAAWYFIHRTNTWERPLFEDKQKVKFDGLAWVPSRDGGLFMAGLTINLSK